MAVPIKGLSEVIGIIDETVLRNIVRDNRIVTPSSKTEIIIVLTDRNVRGQESRTSHNKAYNIHLITLIVALMYFPLP